MRDIQIDVGGVSFWGRKEGIEARLATLSEVLAGGDCLRTSAGPIYAETR